MKFISCHYCHVSYLNVFFFKCFVTTTTTIFPSTRPIYCITKRSVHVSSDYPLVSVKVVDGQWAQCILSSIFTTSICNIFLLLFVTLSWFTFLWLAWPVSVIIIVEGAKFLDDIEYCDVYPLNLSGSYIEKCIFAKFGFLLQLMLAECVSYSVSHTACHRLSQLHWPVEAPCCNT